MPNASEVNAAVRRILATPAFARSPRLAQFLRFAVEQRLSGAPPPQTATPTRAASATPILKKPTPKFRVLVAALLAVALVTLAFTWNAWRNGAGKVWAKTLVAHPKSVQSPAAELYLKGRFFWNKRTPEDLQKAVDYFTQSIVADPGYAKAYVGLADSYGLMREFAAMPDAEAWPRALAASRKAIELDDSLAEAHSSLGFDLF